jgi:hypothetical protein
MLKQQIHDRAPELKDKLVSEFSELTHKDLEDTATTRTRSSTGSNRRLGSRVSRSQRRSSKPRADDRDRL